MNRLIVYLIRKKFRLKKFDCFRFTNQKSNDIYYFGKDTLFKISYCGSSKVAQRMISEVSLNWLLDEKCEVVKVKCPCSDKMCATANVKIR